MPEADRSPRKTKQNRLLPIAVSLAGHVLVLTGLLWAKADKPQDSEPTAISVALIQPPEPPPPPPPPEKPSTPIGPPEKAAAPASTKSVRADKPRPAPRSSLRPTPAPQAVEPLPASPRPVSAPTLTVGEGQLASAGTADGPGGGTGAGGGGQGCNMVKLVQTALRKNARVRAAIAQAHPEAVSAGKAILVWNGDWIRSGLQEGKGLAGLRQAIALEVAFAPEACRADPVRGLVLIKLSDGPGAVRLVMGHDRWRWSDLLFN